MQATLGPGTCGPLSLALRNAAGSSRCDQPVRISTQLPAGIRPCFASQASTWRGLEQEIGIGRDLLRAVDHAGGCDEELRRDCVGMSVRQLAAGDPVRRRVEMRAGMLAAGDVVPVPGRAALVVARDLLDPERLRGGQGRRQLDHRRRRPQWLGQIDDPDPAARYGRDEAGKKLLIGHGLPPSLYPARNAPSVPHSSRPTLARPVCARMIRREHRDGRYPPARHDRGRGAAGHVARCAASTTCSPMPAPTSRR